MCTSVCGHLGTNGDVKCRMDYLIVPLLHAHISMSALPPYLGLTRVQGILLHIR